MIQGPVYADRHPDDGETLVDKHQFGGGHGRRLRRGKDLMVVQCVLLRKGAIITRMITRASAQG